MTKRRLEEAKKKRAKKKEGLLDLKSVEKERAKKKLGAKKDAVEKVSLFPSNSILDR